jgi:hypothetical protein
MNIRHALAAAAAVSAMLACSLITPDSTPTSPPTDTPRPAPTAVPATVTSGPAPFTGTWVGPDPDDGSIMTLTLTQTGSALVGAYSDSFSLSVPPPGYNGTITGGVTSWVGATITMNLSRHDGAALNLQADLTLNGDGTLKVDVTSVATGVWILQRQ